jgi:methyl-accepting chemotaxis protein
MNIFENMSLRAKLLSGFGAVTLIVILVGVVAMWGASADGAAQDRHETAEVYSALAVTARFEAASFNGFQTAYGLDVVRGVKGATSNSAPNRRAYLKSRARFTVLLKQLQALQVGAAFHDEVVAVAAATTRFDALDAQAWRLYQKHTAAATSQASEIVVSSEAKVYGQIADHLASLSTIEDTAATRDSVSQKSTQGLVTIVMIAMILIGVAIAAAIGLLFSRALVRRIQRVRDGATAVAAGDLTVVVTDDSSDEIGEVTRAFGDMVASLSSLVGEAGRVAQTLAAASQQMASTSEEAGRAVGEIANAVSDVATGAERQVQMVESARSSAEEVGQAVNESAASAQETAAAANEARTIAEHGVTAANSAGDAMQAVRASSADVSQAMQGLAAKSEQIGGIVETITAIAGQTNLLALNAAIEAARAGEQGRGFAVVAEEVRKLAEESQQAASSISELVADIQHETERTVSVVEDGARKSDEGVAVVEQTRDAFLQIGTSVEGVAARIEQIAGASQQIAASTTSMQESMNEVAAVAEQSSAGAEQVSASTEETSASTQEIAASAQELARTAEELTNLVGQFKVAA